MAVAVAVAGTRVGGNERVCQRACYRPPPHKAVPVQTTVAAVVVADMPVARKLAEAKADADGDASREGIPLHPNWMFLPLLSMSYMNMRGSTVLICSSIMFICDLIYVKLALRYGEWWRWFWMVQQAN